MSNATFSYQWIRSDGSTDSDIEDATGSTYTLVSDDSGKAIKVRVSFSDDAGNEELLISAPLDPSVPYGLVAAVSGDAVVLTWNAPVDFDYLLDYQVLRHRPELDEPEPLVHVNTRSTETTYTDTDVEPGVLYVYQVKGGQLRLVEQGVRAGRDTRSGIDAGRERPGHRRAHRHRLGASGRDPDGGHIGHRRRTTGWRTPPTATSGWPTMPRYQGQPGPATRSRTPRRARPSACASRSPTTRATRRR